MRHGSNVRPSPLPLLRPARALVLLAGLAGLAALPAQADDHCAHSRPLTLAPDLEGVKRVRFEIGAHELDLRGSDGPLALEALACVSDPGYFEQIRFSQDRRGDTLVVTARREGRMISWFFNPSYAYLKITARLPRDLAYDVDVGSGDAHVRDVARLESRVGSGDIEVSDIEGQVEARVGSGDFEAANIGSLEIGSIGSGDAEVRGVKGDARVGSIGSGDLDLLRVGGDVEIGSIGSGDATLRGIGGSVTIQSIGSGDADVIDVAGDLTVHSIGSGDVDARDVRGRQSLPDDR